MLNGKKKIIVIKDNFWKVGRFRKDTFPKYAVYLKSVANDAHVVDLDLFFC